MKPTIQLLDLEKELLKEHSKGVRRIVVYVGNRPERFTELMNLFQSGTSVISQRSVWVMSLCAEVYPELAAPHLKKLLKILDKKNLHVSVKRNIMRLLQFVVVPKGQQGVAASHAFRYLQDPAEAIAVRVFAMTVSANIALQQPDLKNELLLLIEDQLPYGSPGFVSRARKVIALLTKETDTRSKRVH